MKDTTVLLVDDEVPFVESMTKKLTQRGISVVTAFSGEGALNHLRDLKNTDVVVLDVKMPGMDGIETLREIKRRYPLVEVIILTGHATVETAIEAMKLGAFDYLMKPCEIELLVPKLQEARKKREEQEEKILRARVT